MFVWAGPSVQLHLPVAVSPASLANLGAYLRDVYRLHFAHELAAGARKPLVLPYAVLGSFVLPVVYLAIPHVRRPWLYRARWLLLACIVALNGYETATTSSANFAIGYAVGLMQAWGILWAATLLGWMRPQFEAARVEKRKRRRRERENEEEEEEEEEEVGSHGGRSSGLETQQVQQQNGHVVVAVNGHATSKATTTTTTHTNTNINTNTNTNTNGCLPPDPDPGADAPDEDIATSLRQGYEYYWQAYPADAPLATRLDWSIDLVLSFRGTGWNWGVPVLPHFAPPPRDQPLAGAPLVDLASLPLVTRQGYRRYRTGAEWLRAQAGVLGLSYLALDLLSVLMMKDPYFILGPEFAAAAAAAGTNNNNNNPLALPPFLAALPPVLLGLFRSLVCFAAILVAINLIMTAWQLVAHFLLYPRVFRPLLRVMTGGASTSTTSTTMSARGELWHYPCVYGAFVPNVLDRGLAGFWGAWWHQTFRTAFSAPSLWLARHGWINLRSPSGKAVAGLLAFAQSGFLHALGSVSCLPPSRPWLPPVFFLLCWVGILLQTALAAVLSQVLLWGRLPLLLLGGGSGGDATATTTAATTTANGDDSAKKQSSSSSPPPPSSPSPSLPTWLRRTGNFVFVFGYLHACQFLLCDDLGRSGIWLLEPVPASPLRALGLGKPGDSWWRWDPALWPRWHFGGRSRWWETGLAL